MLLPLERHGNYSKLRVVSIQYSRHISAPPQVLQANVPRNMCTNRERHVHEKTT